METTAIAITESLLSRLSDFVAHHMGLNFPRERWHDFERGIRAAAREFGFTEPESCIQWLLSSPLSREQVEVLAFHLTVGETYFFRDRSLFKYLEEKIFPQLIESNSCSSHSLRIWCAGCSTGEEPYSLAILLNRILPSSQQWNITILGTDINRHVLEVASDGVYGDWSFRSVPPWFKQQYFTETSGGRWEIAPSIKKMVTFSCLNLADDHYPSLLNNTNAMDLILCCNVLMYFIPRQAEKVIEQFNRSLTAGGWFAVSPTETSQVRFSSFEMVSFPGAFFYRKRSASNLANSCSPEMEIIPTLCPVDTMRPVKIDEPDLEAIDMFDMAVMVDVASIEDKAVETEEPDLYAEALALYEMGRYGEASALFDSWPEKFREAAKAAALMARIHANQGKLVEAVDWCKMAIGADKSHAGYCYLLATILQELGREEEALKYLRQTLYLDQDFVLGHFTMGTIVRHQGKQQESRRHFENTLTLLSRFRQDEPLPEAEGMTAGRLAEIVKTTNARAM